ncbi:MAG: DMT family transporter [Alphaproteobacteria bacterium]
MGDLRPSRINSFSIVGWTGPVQAAFWMVFGAAVFATMNGVVRHTADLGMHPFQVAFLRSAFALPFVLPFLWKGGIDGLKTQRPVLYLFRGTIGALALLSFIYAISYAPLAQVTATTFAAPLFATAGSAVFLREVVRLRRWSAVLVGFIGVLIIVRPGGEMDNGTLAAVAAACFFAASALMVKSLTGTEPVKRIVFWTTLMMTVGTAPAAAWVWTPMTWEFLGLGIVLGAFGVVGQACLAKAFAAADASVVMPLDYVRLPFAAFVGWVAFSEPVEPLTWLGAAVIAGSALYITRRESQLNRPHTPTTDPSRPVH